MFWFTVRLAHIGPRGLASCTLPHYFGSSFGFFNFLFAFFSVLSTSFSLDHCFSRKDNFCPHCVRSSPTPPSGGGSLGFGFPGRSGGLGKVTSRTDGPNPTHPPPVYAFMFLDLGLRRPGVSVSKSRCHIVKCASAHSKFGLRGVEM